MSHMSHFFPLVWVVLRQQNFLKGGALESYSDFLLLCNFPWLCYCQLILLFSGLKMIYWDLLNCSIENVKMSMAFLRMRETTYVWVSIQTLEGLRITGKFSAFGILFNSK